ncbi:MAG: amidohydrolase family protein [Candidatus Bipolaricaulota bacterium]
MSTKSGVLLTNAKPLGFETNDQKLSAPLDVRIDQEGKVAEVGSSLRPLSGGDERVIDLEGGYLSPGWIDIHTHIYHGVCDLAIDPDRVGPETGVAQLVDAGSAGEANFPGFRDYIAETRDYPIKSFLNIGSIGLTAGNRISELTGPASVNHQRIRQCVKENEEIIKGIKIRASKTILGDTGDHFVKMAKNVARNLDLPLVVHVGEPPIIPADLLEGILDPGDMVTHVFHGKVGGSLLERPSQMELFKKAQQEGIIFDLGHGAASFSYQCARQAVENGLKPDTISTDLHAYNYDGPVWDLPTVMSKTLALGMGLEKVIQGVTAEPASFLNADGWCELTEGNRANFTAFECQKGTFSFQDSAAVDDSTSADPGDRTTFTGEVFLTPRYTVGGTDVTEAHSRFPGANRTGDSQYQ